MFYVIYQNINHFIHYSAIHHAITQIEPTLFYHSTTTLYQAPHRIENGTILQTQISHLCLIKHLVLQKKDTVQDSSALSAHQDIVHTICQL